MKIEIEERLFDDLTKALASYGQALDDIKDTLKLASDWRQKLVKNIYLKSMIERQTIKTLIKIETKLSTILKRSF